MSGPFRVLVTGSRTWKHPEQVCAALDAVLAEHPDLVVVHGACAQGVDAVADRWAVRNWVSAERHPAEWRRYRRPDDKGNPAGRIRNSRMVAVGADLCLAFIDLCRKDGCREPMPHGSHGAEDCAAKAAAAGIPVVPDRPWETVTQLELEAS